MNYSWIILLLSIIISFAYDYRTISYSLILILFSKIVYDINFFTIVEFKSGNIQESKLYYKMYTGKLANISNEVASLKDILKQFKLTGEKVYRVFVCYIHAVEGTEKMFKNAFTGIMRYKKTGFIEVNVPEAVTKREAELEEYLFEHQFNITELPKTKSIWSNFNLHSEFSVFNVMKKYYNKLNAKISKTGFPGEMNRQIEEFKTFEIMEIYSENDINFHLPIENLGEFSEEKFKVN
jgi:hypothetical protein